MPPSAMCTSGPVASTRSLVARSSSVVEDSAESSMAGQFESVIGIVGFDAFVDAVRDRARLTRHGPRRPDHPIAVLVQPLIEPAFGGVLFGVDPVTGRSDRRVVSAVVGGPEPLVSGEVDGSRYVLDPSTARSLDFDTRRRADAPERPSAAAVELSARGRGRVRRPAGRRVGDRHRRRAVAAAVPAGDDRDPWAFRRGPIYGPGPVAETFPEPLTELEHDLWVPPLRDAVREAVAARRHRRHAAEVEASDVVVSVDGHVAIDLRLAGEIKPKQTI